MFDSANEYKESRYAVLFVVKHYNISQNTLSNNYWMNSFHLSLFAIQFLVIRTIYLRILFPLFFDGSPFTW